MPSTSASLSLLTLALMKTHRWKRKRRRGWSVPCSTVHGQPAEFERSPASSDASLLLLLPASTPGARFVHSPHPRRHSKEGREGREGREWREGRERREGREWREGEGQRAAQPSPTSKSLQSGRIAVLINRPISHRHAHDKRTLARPGQTAAQGTGNNQRRLSTMNLHQASDNSLSLPFFLSRHLSFPPSLFPCMFSSVCFRGCIECVLSFFSLSLL